MMQIVKLKYVNYEKSINPNLTCLTKIDVLRMGTILLL